MENYETNNGFNTETNSTTEYNPLEIITEGIITTSEIYKNGASFVAKGIETAKSISKNYTIIAPEDYMKVSGGLINLMSKNTSKKPTSKKDNKNPNYYDDFIFKNRF